MYEFQIRAKQIPGSVFSPEICFYVAVYEFQIRAKIIPGFQNRLPDFLSGWNESPKYIALFYSSVANRTITQYIAPDDLFRFSHYW